MENIRQYKIVREIGKGGMGIVYKAIEPTKQKAVAIKVLPPHLVNRATVERFNREAQAMSRLKHPNMIEVFDFGQEDGKHFLVMEYIEGERLKTLINLKKPFPIPECLDIIIQSAEALAYTHQEGIIHRDVKPTNIIVMPDGNVKVMDFGLAKIPELTNLTVEGSVLGTAEYMSPEQVEGEQIDTRSDIYSLGVTLYEMLAGRTPFQADSLQAILMKQKTEPPAPLRELRPDCPAELERITLKAMSKDVAQRYQRVGEMLSDLQKIRGAQPVRKPPVQQETFVDAKIAPSKPERRGSRKIGLVIFGLALAGILAFVLREEIGRVASVISDKAGSSFSKSGQGNLVGTTEKYLKDLEQADAHHMAGLNYGSDGFNELAIKEYKKAIRLRPGQALYYKDLALAYEKNREHKEAKSAWKDVLKYDEHAEYRELAERHLR